MRRALTLVAAIGVVAAWNPPVQAATAPAVAAVSPTSSPASMDTSLVSLAPAVASAFTSAAFTSAALTRSGLTRSSAAGRRGQKLTVTPSRGLSAYGQTVKVTGRGFSELVGIYVGLCVKPRPGAKPTPCGGGVDQDGSSKASVWISSNPPPYGANLAIPYKRGGRFSVTIRVSPRIGSYDCRVVRCAVVARADHTRSSDRTWDVVVPVTFRK